MRPQAAGVPGGINSPVDGLVIAEGRVKEGTLLQAKGLEYRLGELFDGDPLTSEFARARYTTLYLAPKDYHRIHVPLAGFCIAVGRVEGELWPVNATSTASTPHLYVRNRRAYWIARGAREAEGLAVAAVMVAATHVGGVVVDPRWLEGRVLPRRGRLEVADFPCARGDDLGAFELGSTVVLVVGGEKADAWDLTMRPRAGEGGGENRSGAISMRSRSSRLLGLLASALAASLVARAETALPPQGHLAQVNGFELDYEIHGLTERPS